MPARQPLRFPATLAAILLAASISMAFGWLHTRWFAYSPEAAGRVLLFFAAAASASAALFLAGQFLRVKSHAYYVVVSGLAFLTVDAAVWWQFGIMPGPRSYQDGFVPAAVMGVFLGPLYRIIAPVP